MIILDAIGWGSLSESRLSERGLDGTAKLGGFTFFRGRFMCLDVEAVVVFVVSLAPFQSSLSLYEKELGIRRSRPQLTSRKSRPVPTNQLYYVGGLRTEFSVPAICAQSTPSMDLA